MTHLSVLSKNRFKDSPPADTVRRLKEILHKNNIKVEEIWNDTSSIHTSSLRLVIEHTDIGSNGKGISPEYAMASAYAEFFERLQNNHLNTFIRQNPEKDCDFFLYPDEKNLSIQDLISAENSFLDYFFRERNIDKDTGGRKRYLERLCQTGCIYSKQESFLSLPFFHVNTGSIQYLPYGLYRPYYGSNGMCAGNTPSEALLQGLSEIMERAVSRRIFAENPCFPPIPEEDLKEYPHIYERIQIIRSDRRFTVRVLDCSFGGRYPVAGLLVIEKNTGRYGFKLGCHPDYSIAIERTLTEAVQAQDICEFATNSMVDFSSETIYSESNIGMCIMNGQGSYPYSILSNNPTYPYVKAASVTEKNNDSLWQLWCQKLMDEGYDILIRDVSYLGFPSYHIMIPGLSETSTVSDHDYEMIYLLNESVPLFRNPHKIGPDNSTVISSLLEHFDYRPYLSFFYNTDSFSEIPFETIGASSSYCHALCMFLQEDYPAAIESLSRVIDTVMQYSDVPEHIVHELMASMYYLASRQEISSHEEAVHYISLLFEEEYCNDIDTLFGNRQTLMQKVFPSYNDNIGDRTFLRLVETCRNAAAANMPDQALISQIWSNTHE